MSQAINSNNPVHLQNALRSLEDRCQKLHRKVDSLQSENERLLSSRQELLSEVERLQEQQIRLRERNLRLTQEFHSKQQECSLLAEKLTMYARGRVGNVKDHESSSKTELCELKEDRESSNNSLETAGSPSGLTPKKSKKLHKAKRTLSEPNLAMNLTNLHHELELVRKGLSWKSDGRKPTVDELSSKIISNLKHGQKELKEQFSQIEVQRYSLEAVQELSHLSGVTCEIDLNEDSDPVQLIHSCTQGAATLQGKLRSQNEMLRRLHQHLKASQGIMLSCQT